MLHVVLGQNILHATLSERESVASLVYVMKITPIEAKSNVKNIRLTNLSNSADRVNKVAMTVVETVQEEDFNDGKVYLIGGDYIYEIFNQVGKSLERGELKFDTSVSQINYNQNNVQETVYNGE